MRGILQQELLNNSQIALSGEAVRKATGKIPVVYDNLAKLTSIEQLLTSDGDYQTILYVSSRGQGSVSGHYCFLFRQGRFIHFFDSYGLKPDDELNYALHSVPYLSNLLKKSDFSVKYNSHRLQELEDQSPAHTNVCGNYCILRYKTRLSHTDENFYRLLFENRREIMPDLLCSLMTYLVY